MTYSVNTTIKGPSLGTAEGFYAYAKAKGSSRLPDVKLYLETLEKLCRSNGVRYELLVAQSVHEASTDNTGKTPWDSSWWRNRCNPAGIGITGDTAQNNASRDFKTGDAAARAHFLHAWLYAVGASVPTGLRKSDDPRWDEAVRVARAGIAPTMLGFQNTWGMDGEYASKWLSRLNELDDAGLLYEEPAGGVIVPEEPMTNFKKYNLPGLPNPAYFPDWLAVSIKLIPSSVDGWTSGQPVPAKNFTSTTYHDTDNEESSANSEYTWARNGGRSKINSPGSYNGIFDANGLIVTQRFDELVGHAANPTGNVTSYAFEEAFGATGHAKSLNVGEWVHAGILQSMGKSGGTEAMYQHNFWSGKNCPRQIRDRGEWGAVEKAVDAHVAEINAWLKSQGSGGTTTPPPTKPVTASDIAFQNDIGKKPYYTDADTIWFNGVGTYTAKRDTPALKYAVANSGTIRTIRKGDTVSEVAHGVSKSDNKPYILTAARERVLLDDLDWVAPKEK